VVSGGRWGAELSVLDERSLAQAAEGMRARSISDLSASTAAGFQPYIPIHAKT
jgi:hypothetical protein